MMETVETEVVEGESNDCYKTINTHQIVTVIHAVYAVPSKISRIEWGKESPGQMVPTSGKKFPPYCMWRPYGCGAQYSIPPVQGEMLACADSQSEEEQRRQMRQNTYLGFGHDSSGVLFGERA